MFNITLWNIERKQRLKFGIWNYIIIWYKHWRSSKATMLEPQKTQADCCWKRTHCTKRTPITRRYRTTELYSRTFQQHKPGTTLVTISLWTENDACHPRITFTHAHNWYVGHHRYRYHLNHWGEMKADIYIHNIIANMTYHNGKSKLRK